MLPRTIVHCRALLEESNIFKIVLQCFERLKNKRGTKLKLVFGCIYKLD